MTDVALLSQDELDSLAEDCEWEYDPDPEDLEEFSGCCPYCGEEMQCLETRYKNGCEVGFYMCMRCDEDAAHDGSVWVYEDGPYRDHICEDMYA